MEGPKPSENLPQIKPPPDRRGVGHLPKSSRGIHAQGAEAKDGGRRKVAGWMPAPPDSHPVAVLIHSPASSSPVVDDGERQRGAGAEPNSSLLFLAAPRIATVSAVNGFGAAVMPIRRGLPGRYVLTRFRQYPGRLDWCAKATTINSVACSRMMTEYGHRFSTRRFAPRLPAKPGTGVNGTISPSSRSSAASTVFRSSMPSPSRWRSYHAAASAASSAAASRTLTARCTDSRSGCVSVGAVLPGPQGLPCRHRVGRGAAESLCPMLLMHRRRQDHQGWPEGHGRALPAR